ncbi:polysaccharide biosynthesis/export family protein [Shimia sp. R9_1]|uniref:polysaccharide biosynthesis/export family protein n=1 Tax=Shimia sp. R9_1 TaxID=2821111 RepID=UPI001AD9F90C|nr:polysaccharide biosynthesis/export family protein [Shimia sp. R9_1]MBO9409169.1 polysaccharide biosynthesis/export family protein [Shimia sp. R9_1]
MVRASACALGLSAALLSLGATLAYGEGYKLVIGDRLQASLLGESQPMTGTVDLDGYLRFAGLAQSRVAGLTLEEAERALEKDLQTAELYVNPDISLAIESHAPIVIVGEVQRPGSFDFLPQLTVELALGLAGGVSLTDLSDDQRQLLQADAKGQLRAAALEITHQTVRIARLEAQLAQKSVLAAEDVDPREMPVALPEITQAQLGLEQQLLSTFIAQGSRQDALWDQHLKELETEIALLDSRIEIQQDVVLSRVEELEGTRSLAERGLQRATIVTAQERLESEARARILELEAQKSRAQSDWIAASRAQSNFHDQRRIETLEALRSAVQARDGLRQRYENQRQRLAVLSSNGLILGSASDLLDMNYVILRRTNAGIERLDATSDTVVLPGDAVIVSALMGNAANDF